MGNIFNGRGRQGPPRNERPPETDQGTRWVRYVAYTQARDADEGHRDGGEGWRACFWGHKLDALEQGEDNAKVTFANGVRETFSFVVGCYGLHSNTRTCLSGEHAASYTGFAQIMYLSP